MKRVWGHVVAGLSLLAGAGVTFSACVHDDSTIFVRQVIASQFVTNGTACTFTNDPMQASYSSGILDIALRTQYDAEFLVGNQMVAQANSSQLQTETSTVTLEGAVVRVTDRKGVQVDTFTRLTAATIFPATGSIPGYAPVSVTILSQTAVFNALMTYPLGPLGQSGSTRLIAYVRFFGHSLGGQSVESNEFEFPVDVCDGCLINFANDPHFMTPNCVGNGASTTAQPQIPCIPGEDLHVDCSYCNALGCGGAYQPPPGALDAGSG